MPENKVYVKTKRCPCCGAKPSITVSYLATRNLCAVVRCRGCLLRIERFVAYNIPDGKNEARQAAVKAWNLRATVIPNQTN